VIVTDRLIRILHVDGQGLLASDVYGQVHLLHADLQVVRSSPFVRPGRPVYGLAIADGRVIGKHRMGAILRWRLSTTLVLLRRIATLSRPGSFAGCGDV
jgi:hypothetical protein